MEINGISSSEYTFKVKEEGVKELAVDCIARQSTPLPRFEWKLDGKPIEVISSKDIFVHLLNLSINIPIYESSILNVYSIIG